MGWGILSSEHRRSKDMEIKMQMASSERMIYCDRSMDWEANRREVERRKWKLGIDRMGLECYG